MQYVNNKFNSIQIEDLDDDNFPESVRCRLEFEKSKTLIGICYRSPDSTKISDESLFNLFAKISDKDVVIMGDFNYPKLNWKGELLNNNCAFIDCLNDNFFMSNGQPKSTRGDNILDLVMTSNEDLIDNLRVEESFSTSDHGIIRFNVNVGSIYEDNVRKQFNYFKGKYDAMREDIREIDWQVRFNNLSVEEMWKEFKEVLYKLREESIPVMKRRNTKQKWVTKEVTKCRRAKEKSWKKYIKSGKNADEYKNYVEKLQDADKINKQAKVEFEKKLASNIKKDSKSFLL